MIEKPQNEVSKYSIDGKNNIDTKHCYVEESCRHNKASAKCPDVTKADRCSKRETPKSVFPNLSSIHKANFRLRLYYQLNVVGRRSKLPSHLYSFPSNSNSRGGRGYEGRIHKEFERSKPIMMSKGRMIDGDGGGCDREWPVGPVSRSDNEDFFTLNIEL